MGCFIEGHPNIELAVSESKLRFIQNGKKHEKMKKEIKKGEEHRLFIWSAVNLYFTYQELKNSFAKDFYTNFFFSKIFLEHFL